MPIDPVTGALIMGGISAAGRALAGDGGQKKMTADQLNWEKAQERRKWGLQDQDRVQGRANTEMMAPARRQMLAAMMAKIGQPVPPGLTDPARARMAPGPAHVPQEALNSGYAYGDPRTDALQRDAVNANTAERWQGASDEREKRARIEQAQAAFRAQIAGSNPSGWARDRMMKMAGGG